MNTRYDPLEKPPVLMISKPLLAAFLEIMYDAAFVMVPDVVPSRRAGKHCHILTLAPVNPVGIAGVGNCVGKVSVAFVHVADGFCQAMEICHVTRFPTWV